MFIFTRRSSVLNMNLSRLIILMLWRRKSIHPSIHTYIFIPYKEPPSRFLGGGGEAGNI
jgi:hypothetical protein